MLSGARIKNLAVSSYVLMFLKTPKPVFLKSILKLAFKHLGQAFSFITMPCLNYLSTKILIQVFGCTRIEKLDSFIKRRIEVASKSRECESQDRGCIMIADIYRLCPPFLVLCHSLTSSFAWTVKQHNIISSIIVWNGKSG